MADALSVTDLKVVSSASGMPLVSGVSLSVTEGEFVGLVGESGSGKTTVGFACLGFARRGTTITEGKVKVGEHEPTLMSSADLLNLRRHYIAYVPQSAGYALNPALMIGRQLRDRLFGAVAKEDVLLEALEQVALPRSRDFLMRYPHQLSGGQQQRVIIAAAMLANPKVVIFDEPTTGLDVAVQAQILDMIRSLCTARGMASLFISHDLAAVASLCSRTIVMRFGGVVEAGPTAAILNRPVDPYTRSLVKAVPSLAGALAESRRVAQAASSKPIPPTKNGLAVKSLVAFYGDHQVLHGIDLAFAAGECTAIVGESGSGKTTLCRSLIGLHSRYSGTVTLNGATLDPHARRRTISQRRELQYVFQNPYDSLNPRKTVRDLILQPMVFLREPVAPDFVARQLDRVSLRSGMADRFPHQLSGGERQRVALARALAVQPRVLICDEVTSALDVSVQASVIELIGRLRRELGLTIIFVTHYLALVPQIAQRVAVVRAGRIVDVGPTSAVFDSPGSAYTRELLEKTLDLPQVEIS